MAKEELSVSELFNDDERALIARGLDKIINEVDRVSVSAENLHIQKAAKEVLTFKHQVETLKNRIIGKVPLV